MTVWRIPSNVFVQADTEEEAQKMLYNYPYENTTEVDISMQENAKPIPMCSWYEGNYENHDVCDNDATEQVDGEWLCAKHAQDIKDIKDQWEEPEGWDGSEPLT